MIIFVFLAKGNLYDPLFIDVLYPFRIGWRCMSLACFRSAIGLNLDIEEVLIQRVNHKASAKILRLF